MRTLATLMVSFAVLATPLTLSAQSVVGGVAGWVESKQLREREADSKTRTGVLLGAWVDVETPKSFIHVLAEASYVQRGGGFEIAGPGSAVAEVRADFLTTMVAPMVRAGAGPGALFVYAGPVLEFPLQTRSGPSLGTAYTNPNEQVFALAAGAGVEGRTGPWSIRAEARIVREFSTAFSGASGDFSHRSTEVLIRIGRLRGS